MTHIYYIAMTQLSVATNVMFSLIMESIQLIILTNLLITDNNLFNEGIAIHIIFAVTFAQKIIHFVFYAIVQYNMYVKNLLTNIGHRQLQFMNIMVLIILAIGLTHFDYCSCNYNTLLTSFLVSTINFCSVNEIMINYATYITTPFNGGTLPNYGYTELNSNVTV